MKKEEQIKSLEEEKENLIKEHKETKKELSNINNKMYEEMKPFEDKIKEIRNKYQNQIATLETKEGKQSDRINYGIPKEVANLKSDIEIDKAKKEGKHNIESIEAFMSKTGKRYEEVIEKKPLNNGVQIFRVTDYDYTLWLAFKGIDLVGISYRRKGEHRGDETIPYSYIGGIDEKHLTKIKKETRYSQKYIIDKSKKEYQTTKATFTEWKDRLESTTINYMIPLSDKVMKCLKESEDLGGKGWDY